MTQYVSCCSSGYTVRFFIDTYGEATRTAICFITSVEGGSDPLNMPGQGTTPLEIHVCDPTGCYFTESSGSILGRQGWAKWMRPLEPSVCQPEPNECGEFNCQWEVFSICGALVVCES